MKSIRKRPKEKFIPLAVVLSCLVLRRYLIKYNHYQKVWNLIHHINKATIVPAKQIVAVLEPIRNIVGTDSEQLLRELQIGFVLLCLYIIFQFGMLIYWFLMKGRIYSRQAAYYNNMALNDHYSQFAFNRLAANIKNKIIKRILFLIIADRIFTLFKGKMAAGNFQGHLLMWMNAFGVLFYCIAMLYLIQFVKMSRSGMKEQMKVYLSQKIGFSLIVWLAFLIFLEGLLTDFKLSFEISMALLLAYWSGCYSLELLSLIQWGFFIKRDDNE